MRAEAWMDHNPTPTRSPLQIAEADVRHWSSRLRELTEQLLECESEFASALKRRDDLERSARR